MGNWKELLVKGALVVVLVGVGVKDTELALTIADAVLSVI